MLLIHFFSMQKQKYRQDLKDAERQFQFLLEKFVFNVQLRPVQTASVGITLKIIINSLKNTYLCRCIIILKYIQNFYDKVAMYFKLTLIYDLR